MSLSGSRLTGTLHTDIKSQLVAIFTPTIPAGASGAQTAQIDASWDKIAQAVANAAGPDVVTEITGHAVVNPDTLAITPSLIIDSTTHPCSGNGLVNIGTGTVS